MAAAHGSADDAVSLLLSAGADNREVFDRNLCVGVRMAQVCPLTIAASRWHQAVARVMKERNARDRGINAGAALGGSRCSQCVQVIQESSILCSSRRAPNLGVRGRVF